MFEDEGGEALQGLALHARVPCPPAKPVSFSSGKKRREGTERVSENPTSRQPGGHIPMYIQQSQTLLVCTGSVKSPLR